MGVCKTIFGAIAGSSPARILDWQTPSTRGFNRTKPSGIFFGCDRLRPRVILRFTYYCAFAPGPRPSIHQRAMRGPLPAPNNASAGMTPFFLWVYIQLGEHPKISHAFQIGSQPALAAGARRTRFRGRWISVSVDAELSRLMLSLLEAEESIVKPLTASKMLHMGDRHMRRDLAAFVSERRAQLGLSEIALSEMTKTSKGVVNKVCNGSQPIPLDHVEGWIAALQLKTWQEKNHFIMLCNREKARQKKDLAGIRQDYEDAIQVERSHREALLSAISQSVKALLSIEADMLDVTNRDVFQRVVKDLDNLLLNHSCPSPPVDPKDALPWSKIPEHTIPGMTMARGLSLFPADAAAEEHPNSQYRIALNDASGRCAGEELFICVGKSKLEQRSKRWLAKLAKDGLPDGWYVVSVGRWAFNTFVNSTDWLYQVPQGKLVCSPVSDDDR